uniref:ATP synthase subunit a n=1 Tax=Pomacea aulanieri TaxID=2842512 RepID=A0AA96M012_9CAEN|nr:ATP synthase F0 subunit 6 [Pomacea aulanieri]WNR57054.1 ATP synthase F0 subunit 6 [Pomacea aulanieri]
MLVDIFSSFDDHNQVFMSMYFLTWGFTFFIVLAFTLNYWLYAPRWSMMISIFKTTISSQIFRSFSISLGGFTNVISGLFLLLIFMNLLGLIPYVFSPTSHLVISLCIGLPMWLSLILSAVAYNFSSVVAGLLPMGAPAMLNPFLVLIESVSISVRPITLSVRLMANMSAGHIVLGLTGNYLAGALLSVSLSTVMLLIMVQVFYTVFEFGISLIQAYIFCLLITLYSDEHPHS